MSKLTRRQFTGRAAGTVLAPLAFGAVGRSARAETRLRLFWWGNPDRDQRTFQVVDLYQQNNPEIRIDAESIGWDDYWPKMATQAAGQNMADVVQMDYRYLFEYARREQLEPLDDYIGEDLDLSNFDDSFLDSGRVDGKLYAVPWTSNSTACFYDTERLAEFGITAPDPGWTYDDLIEIARAIKEAAPRNYWGVADKGHWEPMLEVFVRQRGKSLYTEDGGLGYGEEDLADYLAFWDGMRQEGLLPPADITVQDTNLQQMPITLGRVPIDFAHSNQLVGLQALNPHELGMTMLPNREGGQPGQYMKPSMLVSVSRTSQVKPEAVRLTAFLVSDLDAGAILRVERGVPGDERVRGFLLDKVTEEERKMIDYLSIVAENVSPLPPPPPRGAGEIEKMLVRLYAQLAFGRVSVSDGAAQIYRDAEAIIRRA